MAITRVLVANRGEIARRVFATCRRLGLGTVAVYTDPDADAPHVAEADARVRLPQTNDYLNAEAIIAAARAAGADAVHPGYGFLSENADFAAAVHGRGPDLDRPAGGRGARDGLQDRVQEADGRRRGAGARRTRPGHRHRRPAAGAGEGILRRRRARDAGGPRIRRAAKRSGRRPARGPVRVRRPHRVLRALPAHRPPRRGSSSRRHPRHRVGGRGAGMLDSASPPEDHRGSAVTIGRAHTGHAGQAVRRRQAGCRRDRLHRCGDGGVPRRR